MITFQLSKRQHILWGGIFLLTMMLLLYSGCSSSKGPKSQSSPGISSDYELNSINKDPANPGASSGRKLFETIGCVGCHTVNGQGGNVGPNLSDEANKGRTRQWLTTQIENPRTNDPQSIMPAYNNLSAEQISDLVDYLLSLSGQSNSNVSMQHVTQVKAKNTNPSLSEAGQEWSEICGQCHNLRPPSEYDDSQWIAAVDQMRLLVPLTGQEQSDILEFLKANN